MTTGVASGPLPGACNAVPVARGDGSYDLYEAEDGEIVRISPDGTTTVLPYAGQILRHAFGAGPRQVSSMSADGKVACVTVGSSAGPFSRPLQCEIVLEPATGKLITTINTNNPDPQPGTVEFLADGRMLMDNGTKVSLRSADGYTVLAESHVPAVLQGMDLLSYRP